MKQKGLIVEVEKMFEVHFRTQKVGVFKADLVIETSIILEIKSCKSLCPEHQAQVINYLKATNLSIGLLVNFGNKKLEYKRLYHPNLFSDSISFS